MKHGKELVSKIVMVLHINKCTADYKRAKEFYDHYSNVSEKFLKIRDICFKREKPFRLELYHNLKLSEDGKKVEPVICPETLEGIIKSSVDRFGTDFNDDIYNQWKLYTNDSFIES